MPSRSSRFRCHSAKLSASKLDAERGRLRTGLRGALAEVDRHLADLDDDGAGAGPVDHAAHDLAGQRARSCGGGRRPEVRVELAHQRPQAAALEPALVGGRDRLEPRRGALLRRLLGDLERVGELLGMPLRRSETRRQRLVEPLVERADRRLHPLADPVEGALDGAEADPGLGPDRLPHRVDTADDVGLGRRCQELVGEVRELRDRRRGRRAGAGGRQDRRRSAERGRLLLGERLVEDPGDRRQDGGQNLGQVEHELEDPQAAEEDEQRADAVAQEEHQRVDGVLDPGARDADDGQHGDEARVDDAEDRLEHRVDRGRDDPDDARREPPGKRERVEHDREHSRAQEEHVAEAELQQVDDRELDVTQAEQERRERADQQRHEQDQPVDDVRDPADEVEVGVHRARGGRRRGRPARRRGPEHGRHLAQDLAQRPQLDHDARPVARRLLLRLVARHVEPEPVDDPLDALDDLPHLDEEVGEGDAAERPAGEPAGEAAEEAARPADHPREHVADSRPGCQVVDVDDVDLERAVDQRRGAERGRAAPARDAERDPGIPRRRTLDVLERDPRVANLREQKAHLRDDLILRIHRHLPGASPRACARPGAAVGAAAGRPAARTRGGL